MKVDKMAPNARKAYQELLGMGIPVKDWGIEEGYSEAVQFILPWADEEIREIYADFDNSRKNREYLKDKGSKYIARIREDIHLVLKKYKLVSDFWTSAQIAIYNSDCAGTPHDAKWLDNE